MYMYGSIVVIFSWFEILAGQIPYISCTFQWFTFAVITAARFLLGKSTVLVLAILLYGSGPVQWCYYMYVTLCLLHVLGG